MCGKFYDIKIVDGKYKSVKLKHKADDKQPKPETQKKMPCELGKEKEPKFEERRQNFDEQPDITDIPEWESDESAEQRRKEKKINKESD